MFTTGLSIGPCGLFCAFSTLSKENKQILAQLNPPGIPRFEKLPVVIVGCPIDVLQKKLIDGQVVPVAGDKPVDPEDIEDAPSDGEQNDAEPVIVEDTYIGDDLGKQVNSFLEFIRDQRSKLGNE